MDDPAADFLASEENKLAELGDEEVPPPMDFPEHDADAVAMDAFGGSSDFIDDDVVPASIPTTLQNGDIGGESGGFALDDSAPLDIFDQPHQPSSESDAVSSSVFPSSMSSAASKPLTREEPETIRLWRVEQKERIERMDEEEMEKKEAMLQSAAKELEDWYANRKEQSEKSKVNNREAEAAFVAERDAVQPGLEWERIHRLVDFAAKPGIKSSAKDVSRLRQIMLNLKVQPPPIMSESQA